MLRPRFEREERQPKNTLCLRFSPYAWAKLLFFRDAGDTEIGGFGVTPADDLLYVEDFLTVKQQVTCASVAFSDEAVSDYFETQVDQGRKPEQFARIWLHSHPGNFPNPSGTDEATFQRVFSKCQWSVMAIIAQEGKTYARISFNIGPGGQVLIPVQVDYENPFPASSQSVWETEYRANIHPEQWQTNPKRLAGNFNDPFDAQSQWPPEEVEEFEGEPGFADPDNPWWWNY